MEIRPGVFRCLPAFCLYLFSAFCLLLSAFRPFSFTTPAIRPTMKLQLFRDWIGSSARFPHVDDPQLELRKIQAFGHHCYWIRHLCFQSYLRSETSSGSRSVTFARNARLTCT